MSQSPKELKTHRNPAKLDESGNNHVFGASKLALMPMGRVLDEVIFWQHPWTSRLHRKRSIVHKKYEISALSVSSLAELIVRFTLWGFSHIAVHAELDGHSAPIPDIHPYVLLL